MTHEQFQVHLAERWRWANWLAMWNLIATFNYLGVRSGQL